MKGQAPKHKTPPSSTRDYMELCKEDASKDVLGSQDAFFQVWKRKLISIGATEEEKANPLYCKLSAFLRLQKHRGWIVVACDGYGTEKWTWKWISYGYGYGFLGEEL